MTEIFLKGEIFDIWSMYRAYIGLGVAIQPIFVMAEANIRTCTNIAKTNIHVCEYSFCANNTREWRVYSILVPYLGAVNTIYCHLRLF
jgi:hypothetical protein